MPQYSTTLGTKHFSFADLREVMAKATPLRSGDVLAGVAAANEKERAAAQRVLAEAPLERFLNELLIPYEDNEVSRLIMNEHDAAAFSAVKGMSVGEFREWLLAYETTEVELAKVARGLTPEMVAAVSKICRNQDLILIAKKCRVVTRYRNTLGLAGRVSVALAPNQPRRGLGAIAGG